MFINLKITISGFYLWYTNICVCKKLVQIIANTFKKKEKNKHKHLHEYEGNSQAKI